MKDQTHVDTTNQPASELTHISLCAGYGGIDLGLHRVFGQKLRTIAFSEIEAFAVENLLAKMEAGLLPAAPVWTDLRTFPWADFQGVDLLSGGFPCQPFSAAGKRNADSDPRHLFPAIIEGIRHAKPGIVFLENVEGIVSAKLAGDDWRDPAGTSVLLHVLRELERVGYRATAGIFSASEVGAPHQRKRVFILAYRSDSGLQGREWFRQTGTQGESGGYASECGSAMANNNSKREPQYSMSESISSESTSFGNCCSNRGDAWQKVVWAAECECSCEEPGCAGECGCLLICAGCGGAYSECGCYGPTQDGIEYEWRDGILYGRPEQAWPSRPGEQQHAWEPPRVVGNASEFSETEPSLGRDADGPAGGMDYAELCISCDNRTDELRLLGNGVVPATAERAFVTLMQELTK
jgi:DNA (cytosine-5)-methyltransferase 1